jgi:hypothetical protein
MKSVRTAAASDELQLPLLPLLLLPPITLALPMADAAGAGLPNLHHS